MEETFLQELANWLAENNAIEKEIVIQKNVKVFRIELINKK